MRIGLHVNNLPDETAAIRYIETVQPPLCKFLVGGFNRNVLDACKANGVKTVLRMHTDDQVLLRQVLGNVPRKAKPAISARAAMPFIDTATALAAEHGFTFVEGYNEVYQTGAELARYAEFDIALMQKADERGVKAMIGSFSTGNPPDSWAPYLPALRYAGQHGHVVGLHEYSAPVLQYGTGSNQWNGGAYTLTDPVSNPDALGWWTLRYRRARAEWRTLGVNPLPDVAITESGIDDVQPRPHNTPGRGWRTTLGTEWENKPPFGTWAEQARWYAWQLSQDSYIIGAVGFGWGALDPAWMNFRDDADEGRLKVFMAAQLTLPRGSVNPPPPPSGFLVELKKAIPNVVDLIGSLPRHQTLRYATRSLAQISEISVHHTTGPTTYTPQQCAVQHVEVNGWPGIGYTFWIDRAGILYYCNDITTVSYHVGTTALPGDENLPAIGLAYPGDYRKGHDTPTPEQRATTARFVPWLNTYLGKTLLLRGHRDVAGGTECPGENLMALITELNQQISPPPANLETLRNAAWNALYPAGGIAYAPTHALIKFASVRKLGLPVTGEFTYGQWTAQGFRDGIAYAITGKWEDVKVLDWL